MEKSLDELLAGNEVETPEVETPEVTEEEPQGQPRGPDGKFAKKEETGVETSEEPPSPPSDQLPKEEYSALKDERRKRQELERRLQAMEQSITQRQQQEQPTPEFWDDPKGFMSTEMSRFGETLLQQWEQRQRAQRIDESEAAAKQRHPDYEDAFAAFEQAVQANPRLALELAQAADPGEYAYSKGKAALTLNQVGSLDDLKNQWRQEWEAEVRAVVPQPRPVLPSTTAADGSVGARSGPEWSGPKPLNQILG